jgi:hypothetical protein
MTVLTVGVVATVVTAGAAAPVAGSALSGIASGVGVGAASAGSATAAAVAGSAGAGAAAGAITGAIAGVSGSAAATGAAVGSASAAAVASSSAGAAGLTTAGIASGPVGWIILGAEPHSSNQHPVAAAGATFDCWKPVVRDESAQLSNGKPLNDIFEDQRIKEIIVHESRNSWNLPELSLVNIWDEQFDINYLVLPYNNQLVAHAVRVS